MGLWACAGLLAIFGTTVVVRTGMKRKEQQKLRKLGVIRDLQVVLWYPKWQNTYNEGFCSNVGVPSHGVNQYTTKQKCCDAWYRQQTTNRCILHDGSLAPGTLIPPVVRVTPPAPGGSTVTPPPSGPPPPVATLPPVPNGCQDLPKYANGSQVTPAAIWAMPDDSVWSNTPFAGKTCSELETSVPINDPVGRLKFCEFLSQGIYSGPCALESCCFCGGGMHNFEARCENIEWNTMTDSGQGFNCEFINDHVTDKSKFCSDFGGVSFAADGLTMGEACCACGGGNRHFEHKFANRRRLQGGRELQENAATSASTAAAAVLPDGKAVVDVNFKDEFLFAASGIPNLEYLGLGYDLIRGNPRGSDSSELDPGFRYRILVLRQEPSNTTVDFAYLVPLGTAVKYTSSCKYDSSSTEVSSESDMRSSMEKEVTSTESSSTSASVGFANLIESFSASVSASYAFSQSEKFESTSATSQKSSSVSFESRAVCSEFEASFIPDVQHELSPEFKQALDNLPVPFNKGNRRHRSIWKKFFSTFGTNYVTYLVLGGKRINSMSMSQQDYSSLVSQSVDVESTMSFEMSAAMGASQQVKAGLVKQAASLATQFGGAQAAMVGSVVSVGLEGVDDDTVLFERSIDLESKYSLGQFAKSKTQAENALEISQTKTTNQEYTIGGLPSEDWRVWASTVKEKPMPIKYRLASLMDLMSYEQQFAFVEAFQDAYGVNISAASKKEFLNATVHHGLYTGSGDPLSAHSLNPNDDSRVLMQVNAITDTIEPQGTDAAGGEVKSQLIFEAKKAKGGWTKSQVDDLDYGACGIKVIYQKKNEYQCGDAPNDLIGIYDIQFEYCNTKKYSLKKQFESITTVPIDFVDKKVKPSTSGSSVSYPPQSIVKPCPPDQFLCGFQIGYCGYEENEDSCQINKQPGCNGNEEDNAGIFAMTAYCKKLGEECSGSPKLFDHCHHDHGGGCYVEAVRRKHYKYLDAKDASIGHDYIISGASTRFDQEEDRFFFADDHAGISAFKLHYTEAKISQTGNGPTAKIITYSDIWKGKPLKPNAHFATLIRKDIAPNTDERSMYPFNTTFNGKEFDSSENNMYFTVTDDVNSNGVLAVMNFGALSLDLLGISRLHSFSFLTVDTLRRYGRAFRSGVVSHLGLMLNAEGRDEFDVSKDKDGFILQFVNPNPAYQTEPTVVAFPNWFSIHAAYFPNNAQDVTFEIGGISTTGFELKHGPSSLDRSYIGFNFLVIGDDMPTENIKHGIIADCFSPSALSTKHGIKIVTCQSIQPTDPSLPAHMAVYIEFDSPFVDIPSVIATPYNSGLAQMGIPRCMVESITKVSTVVKCLDVKTKTDIPFTIVAVGKTD